MLAFVRNTPTNLLPLLLGLFFKVSGTHSIYLTGNYVEPADGADDEYDSEDEDYDSDEYDLSPDSDELDGERQPRQCLWAGIVSISEHLRSEELVRPTSTLPIVPPSPA